MEWASSDDQWSADYVNIRDDRVEVFGSLNAGETKKVVYAVRAVTAVAEALLHLTCGVPNERSTGRSSCWARGAKAAASSVPFIRPTTTPRSVALRAGSSSVRPGASSAGSGQLLDLALTDDGHGHGRAGDVVHE